MGPVPVLRRVRGAPRAVGTDAGGGDDCTGLDARRAGTATAAGEHGADGPAGPHPPAGCDRSPVHRATVRSPPGRGRARGPAVAGRARRPRVRRRRAARRPGAARRAAAADRHARRGLGRDAPHPARLPDDLLAVPAAAGAAGTAGRGVAVLLRLLRRAAGPDERADGAGPPPPGRRAEGRALARRGPVADAHGARRRVRDDPHVDLERGRAVRDGARPAGRGPVRRVARARRRRGGAAAARARPGEHPDPDRGLRGQRRDRPPGGSADARGDRVGEHRRTAVPRSRRSRSPAGERVEAPIVRWRPAPLPRGAARPRAAARDRDRSGAPVLPDRARRRVGSPPVPDLPVAEQPAGPGYSP